MAWRQRRPLPGSVEEAARKIERLMELEERHKRQSRLRDRRPAGPVYVPKSGLLSPTLAPPPGRPMGPWAMTAQSMTSGQEDERSQSTPLGPAPDPLVAPRPVDSGPPPAVPPPSVSPFGHYLVGDGSPRSIPIEQVALDRPVVPSEFRGVRAILSGPNIGTFAIDENDSYQTAGWDKVVLGGVSVNLRGVLTVRANGTYEFQGDYGIEADLFDFDPKPSGERGWFGEQSVRVVNALVPGRPYHHVIFGRVPVRERGGAE